MMNNNQLEQRLLHTRDALAPDVEFVSDVMGRIADIPMDSAKPPARKSLWRQVSGTRWMVAAVVVTAIAGFWSWPAGPHAGPGNGNWWLGASAVYADELVQELEQARIDGVIVRSRTTFVMQDGSQQESSTVNTYFFGRDRYRLDIRDAGKLREIQWYLPEGEELVQTIFHANDGSTETVRHKRDEGNSDPISRLLDVVTLIDQANQRFDPREIEGRRCVGFEIDANKVDATVDLGTYRIWFDTETKRPVLLDFDRALPAKPDRKIKRMISTFDRFDWNPMLPAGTFVPRSIPKQYR